jgi:hypothetical protein
MSAQIAMLLQERPTEEQSRWRLQDLMPHVPGIKSRSGLWRLLRKLGFGYRRSWSHQFSPDPWATAKLEWIAAVEERVQQHPEQTVLLWLDELTFYRLPSTSRTWCSSSGRARKARLTPGHNTVARVVGAVNAHTGQCDFWLRSKIGEPELCRFYAYVRQQYPLAQEIYVIQDCWPVHFLASVCAAASTHGITLVALPTYASWRNPIEKLWRWLKQSILHMHPWADDWSRLKQAVMAFLDRFQAPNLALLRYIGLPT